MAVARPTARSKASAEAYLSRRRDEYGRDEFARRITRRIRLSLTIPEKIGVTDWCEKNLYLPQASTRKTGRFRAFGYQREMLDAIGDTTLREVAIIKSIRLGVTQMMALGLVYGVAHLQMPVSFVTQNVEKAKEFAKTFWEPLFSKGKSNRNRLLKSIKRTYIKGEKQDQWSDIYLLNGAVMRIRAAGSSDSFRGYPSKIGAGDELDAENWKEGKESSKVELYRGRVDEFDDGKLVLASSPTNLATSRIYQRYVHTDQRRRYVPCPHCTGVYEAPHESRDKPNRFSGWQVLRFGNADTKYGIKFEVRNHVAVQATYRCDHCEKEIEEVAKDGYSWKEWMDRHGRWVPTAGSWELLDAEKNEWIAIDQARWEERREAYLADWEENAGQPGLTNGIFTLDDETGERVPAYTSAMPGHRGYHIWSAYSLAEGVTWLSIANTWLRLRREGRGGIQSFTNLHLGEAWEPGGLYVLPNEHELSEITVPYPAALPRDAVFLSGGADVQIGSDDGKSPARLEISVYAWGRRKTAYLVGHWVINAPFPSQACEMALDKLLSQKFATEDGRELGISSLCIDSGVATQAVYEYCARRARWGVNAVKGAKEETGFKKDYGIVAREASTHKDANDGYSWFMVSTLTAKEELAFKLDDGPVLGGIFFPHSAQRSCGGKFFAGLVAERSVTQRNGGVKWVRTGKLTGEPLDCYVYAAAARELARRRIPRYRDIDVEADRLGLPDEPSLVTVDRTLPDRSAQADLISGLLDVPSADQRVVLPVVGKKRKRKPVDFTVSSGGGAPRRGGWGGFSRHR